MKSFFHQAAIAITFLTSYSILTQASNSEEVTSPVTVALMFGVEFHLTVNANGDLSYIEFDEEKEILNALVQDNDHATCFFWRPKVTDFNWQKDKQSLSYRFKKGQGHRHRMKGIKRLYCFDNQADQFGRDTFTLFLENDMTGQHEIVRILIPDDKPYTEFFPAAPDLSQYRKAALLGDPYWASNIEPEMTPGCFLVDQKMKDWKFRTPLLMKQADNYVLSPPLERIVCFRKAYSEEARYMWLRDSYPDSG